MEINKVYHGDCLRMMLDLDRNSIDLLVADPPYEFINKNPKGGGFMKKEKRAHLEKINDTFGMTFNPLIFLESVKKAMKKFNAYIFTNKKLLNEYINFAINNNYSYDILLWLKPNAVPCFNGHYLSDKEYCIYIKDSGAFFNSNLGYNNYFTYSSYPVGKKNSTHPTEKPLSIIEKIIKISSKEGDLVLDPFAGSGTTGVACRNLNRNYILIEKEKKYIDIIYKRLSQPIQTTI